MINKQTNKVEEMVEEFNRMQTRKMRVLSGLCATCGLKDNHDELDINGRTFTHQFDAGVDAHCWNEIDFLRQALTTAYQQGREDERKLITDEIDWKQYCGCTGVFRGDGYLHVFEHVKALRASENEGESWIVLGEYKEENLQISRDGFNASYVPKKYVRIITAPPTNNIIK